MSKNTPTLLLTLAIVNIIALPPLKAQVNIDTTAIAVFWQIADTLSNDKTPSTALWEQFSNHPAYAQIQKSGNRVTHLKRILPIVFRPSHSEKLKEILEGKETMTQYFAKHLHEIKIKREELNAYLKAGKIYTYERAYLRSLKYLPGDIKKETIDLTVYVALFEDNGFGGKVITLDLLHLLNSSDEENIDFLGHEFHHALRGHSNVYSVFVPKDSMYYPVIDALNKLPLEGVASMIDKRKYFLKSYYTDTLAMSSSQKETVVDFQGLVKNAQTNLEQIDAVLSGNLALEEKGRQIFKYMPWSGHAVGFYMASSIEKVFGKDKLIEVQYSCIDFILTYQQASKQDQNRYTFSEETIDFLREIN